MKKHTKIFLLIVFVTTAILTIQLVQANETGTYKSYTKKIDKFKKNQTSKVVGTTDTLSTEGNEMVCFKDKQGNALQYSMVVYGEMGKSSLEYNFIGESQMYVVLVSTMYSSPFETDGAQIHRKEYVIDGKKAYLLDREGRKISTVKWAKAKGDCIYMSKKELDTAFVED